MPKPVVSDIWDMLEKQGSRGAGGGTSSKPVVEATKEVAYGKVRLHNGESTTLRKRADGGKWKVMKLASQVGKKQVNQSRRAWGYASLKRRVMDRGSRGFSLECECGIMLLAPTKSDLGDLYDKHISQCKEVLKVQEPLGGEWYVLASSAKGVYMEAPGRHARLVSFEAMNVVLRGVTFPTL